MKTQIEWFEECIPELVPLFAEHWKELGLFRDRMPLSPQFAEYIRRNVNGQLLLITVRENDELAGYITLQVAPGFHYSKTLTAHTDIFYIAKKFRERGFGFWLIKRAQKELKKFGVKCWYMGFKEHNDLGMPDFLSAFGFAPADIYYSKWID